MEKNGSLAFRNGNIITMDPQQPRAEARVIREGQITAVGRWETIAPAAEGCQLVDLAGKTMLPGFIDTRGAAWPTTSRLTTPVAHSRRTRMRVHPIRRTNATAVAPPSAKSRSTLIWSRTRTTASLKCPPNTCGMSGSGHNGRSMAMIARRRCNNAHTT